DKAIQREAQEIDRMPGFQHAVAPAQRRANRSANHCFFFHSSLSLQSAYAVLPILFFQPLGRWLGAASPRFLLHCSLACLRRSSGDAALTIEVCEAFAFFRQTLEQRRRLPEFAVLLVKFADAVVNFFQADSVRIPHRASAM